jgi:DNA modification methylase
MPLQQATAFRLPFKDKTIQVIFTSPPYYGLRVYDGLQPQVFGGDPACDHVWGQWQESHDVREETAHAKSRTTERFYGDQSRRFDGNHQKHTSGAFCQRCSAWLGHLGNEPTPQMYIEHLVTIGREFWRVLRDDGVLLLNLGDSFAGGKGADPYRITTSGKHMPPQGRGGMCPDFKPKDKLGIPHWAVRELQAAGWYHRVDIPWIKRNGMPDSTLDRPGISHEYFFLLTKSKRYFWDAEAVKQPAVCDRMRGPALHPDEVSTNGNDGLAHRPMESTRQFRTLDTWQDSLDFLIEETLAHLAALEATREAGGLLLDDTGLPLALYGTTQPYPGSHYAVFPPNVVTDLLKGATSERGCCRACGKPWERVVEKEKVNPVDYEGKWTEQDKQASQRRMLANLRARREAGGEHNQPFPEAVTIGFRPACSCEAGEPVPSFVCDPFCGSGTVGQVCRELAAEGRPVTFLGTDLSGEYLATHAAVRAEGRSPEAALVEARERIEKRYRKAKDSLKVIKEEARGQLSFLNGR